jgi:hypothetical protein
MLFCTYFTGTLKVGGGAGSFLDLFRLGSGHVHLREVSLCSGNLNRGQPIHLFGSSYFWIWTVEEMRRKGKQPFLENVQG